jgi:cation-transporting P-type ATPase E
MTVTPASPALDVPSPDPSRGPAFSSRQDDDAPGPGLADAEVEARRTAGQGNKAAPATTRTYVQIVVENTFTFVNNILFLLALALVVVGRPFDALVSLSVIGTNIFVSITQEVRAKRTLDQIAILARPMATARRGGTNREISPQDLVLGDLVRLTLGDQIVLDGRLLSGEAEVDESQLTGESDAIHKSPGDKVSSGSFCMSGSGWYEVTAVGEASYANKILADAKGFRRVLTPLQREIHLVIRIVLAIVVYLQVLIILQAVSQAVSVPQAVGQATILAGLVPNGLFVSIAIAYALAAVRIARMGALVQQANAVESLSNVDTLCLDKTGTLTTTDFKLDSIHSLDGDEVRLRQVLGTVVASARTRNRTAEAIAAACPEPAVLLSGDMPFSSARRFSAVAIPLGDGQNGTGLSIAPGIYALGAPQSLLPRLAAHVADDADAAGSRAVIEQLTHEWASRGLRVLLLTWHPDPALLDPNGDDPLPSDLQPVGLIGLVDVLRPEAAETLARFKAAGVTVRIISGDDPETVAALARQAGLEVGPHTLANGADLDGASREHLIHVARTARIFGRVAPSLKAELVDALRHAGHYVAMIGDGVNDILSLKRSNLAVAMGAGTQATKGVADMILLDNSFGSLASAVEEGNRIRNGMHGILELFLTRVAAMGLLIVSALVVGHFPVELRNASAVTLFTVAVPSVLLTIWAPGGRRKFAPLHQTLLEFVVPAAILSALIGLLVFYGALLQDNPAAVGPGAVSFAPATIAQARSAVTTFLVMSGLLLVLFIAPLTDWLAVLEPKADDLRPAILAAVLAIGFAVVAAVPAGRTLFDLVELTPASFVLVLAATLAWLVAVRTAWRHRLLWRFVGS